MASFVEDRDQSLDGRRYRAVFAALQRGLGRNEDQLISARIYHERPDRFKD